MMRDWHIDEATIIYSVIKAKSITKIPSYMGWTTKKECDIFCEMFKNKKGYFLLREDDDLDKYYSIESDGKIVPKVSYDKIRKRFIASLSVDGALMLFNDEELIFEFVSHILKMNIDEQLKKLQEYQSGLEKLEKPVLRVRKKMNKTQFH